MGGLAADAGQTRVRLTWNSAAFPVAGYFVERHATSGPAGSENWVRLNSSVTPEPLYDDPIGLASNVNLEYRVVAVAFDNAEGPPSNTVPVTLADSTVPEAPSITSASGADGKAQLNFVPALPAEKTAQFLVLRSGSDRDLGVVVGDPLPATARQFTDLYTSPGERYWYRLVAVDKNGNRSDPTPPVAIRVGSPQMPAPPTPTAQFAAAPYPHVTLQLQPPPSGLNLIIERQDQASDSWIRIAGPTSAQTATDNAPASGTLSYRASYAAADGRTGPASATVRVSIP